MPSQPTPPIPDLLTVDDVARILRISTKTVRRRIETGDLPHIRHGRSIRVLQDDLTRYIAGLRVMS